MPESIPWDMALTDSVEGTILEKTKERIKALALPGIEPERVVVRKLAWDDALTPPYVLVTPFPEATPWNEGTNEKDETVFAVMISIVLANARDVTERGMGVQLFWRERLRRALANKGQLAWPDLQTTLTALSANNTFYHSYVESGDKFIEAAKREQRDASYYLLRVKIREARE